MLGDAATGANRHRTMEMINEATARTNSFEEDANWIPEIIGGLSEIIARLPWESHQRELLSLLASANADIADGAAHVLVQKPASLEEAALIAGLDSQSPRTRRLYCVLLASLPQQTEATRKALLRALGSNDDGVRWQAALAIGKAHWPEQPPVAALLSCLTDTNQFVAAAAVHSIASLNATNAAPALMAELKARLESAGLSPEEAKRQAQVIKQQVDSNSGRIGINRILDKENLCLWMEPSNTRGRRRPVFLPSIPPSPGSGLEHVDSGLVNSLIEGLGVLRYQPAEDELFKLLAADRATAAVLALQKLAPDRLADQLQTTALDKQADALRREEAMVYLCYLGATNQVHNLVSLLDDTTRLVHERTPPDREWRICDRAADTIAGLLGWEERFRPFAPASQREALISRVREWANSRNGGGQ
jgi:HEAT repeat protein